MRLRLLPFMARLLAVALLGSLSPLVLGRTIALAAGDQAVAYQNDPAHTGGQGYGGIFSPNATAVQATYHLAAGTPISFRLVWKTNKRQATGASIYAGAG